MELRTLLVLILCISPQIAQLAIPPIIDFDVVFYNMGPFIYKSHNGTHEKYAGMFPKIFEKAMTNCRINFSLKEDLGTLSNFMDVIQDEHKSKPYVNRSMVWLALMEKVPPKVLMRNFLTDIHLFTTPGFEVVVHRDQIGILPKIGNGIYGCRYFMMLIFTMAGGCGILVWSVVSLSSYLTLYCAGRV